MVGEGGHNGFYRRMHAVMNLLSFLFLNILDRPSHQYFITQGMEQSSMFFTFHTVCKFRENLGFGRVGGGRGRIPGLHPSLYEACLKA